MRLEEALRVVAQVGELENSRLDELAQHVGMLLVRAFQVKLAEFAQEALAPLCKVLRLRHLFFRLGRWLGTMLFGCRSRVKQGCRGGLGWG
jgi:hypothetical protein